MIDTHAFTIILLFTTYILLKNKLFTCKTKQINFCTKDFIEYSLINQLPALQCWCRV